MRSNAVELARRASRAASPGAALQAVAALRRHLDALEERHVERARRDGWSWSRIAGELGVTKQAVHGRYAARLRRAVPEPAGPRDAISPQARQALEFARQEAAAMGHPTVGPEHLLLALLRDDRGPAVEALESLGVTFTAVRREVRGLYGEPEDTAAPRGRRPPAPVSARARVALERSVVEAGARRAEAIGVEDFLLGLLRDPQGGAVRALERLGVPPADVESALVSALGAVPGDGAQRRKSARKPKRRPSSSAAAPPQE